MELFSEIYSCYYQVAARVVEEAGVAPITRARAAEIVEEHAFAESGLYLLPRLLEGQWPLLEKADGGYRARVESPPVLPLTKLQRAWLKAFLFDPRMRLFLEDPEFSALENALGEDEPLFLQKNFLNFDVCLDGDRYEDEGYRARFRRILSAVRGRELLCIRYRSPKNGLTEGDFLPLKLEFSRKDDKFRLYAAKISGKKSLGVSIVNLGRIVELGESRESFAGEADLSDYFAANRCKTPLRLRIFPMRNAVERAMLQFASYEKQTEYDEGSDSYLCTVYYDRNDETELLIRVLSFGPAVKVLGPADFLRQVKKRVQRQHSLLENRGGRAEAPDER